MQAETKGKKIVCVHLLNDFSGSPLVLSMVIKGLLKSGNEVELITSGGEGFLSNLDVKYNYVNYSFHNNKWIRLFRFFKAQFALFFKVLAYRNTEVQLYINTLLPCGAALAGKFTG